MTTGRLEALSDGVIAIVITIMVLELKAPHDAHLSGLFVILPEILIYLLSFMFLAIYWNSHHHLFKITANISGKVLWANLHLLFWLSLIPFATKWMGENGFATLPVAAYGVVLFMTATAWQTMQGMIIRHQGTTSPVKHAVGNDLKGKLSLCLYALGIAATLYWPIASLCFYTAVALLWLMPDRRYEHEIEKRRK